METIEKIGKRASLDPDANLLRPIDPALKFSRLHKPNAKRVARGEKLHAIRTIDVTTGKWKLAKQYFDGLIDRAVAGIEGSCMVLSGRTGAGKTHILRHLRKEPELQPFETEEGMRRPLVWIEAPAPCNLRSLGRRILRSLNYPVRKSLDADEVWDRVRANLAAQGVAILIIDEAHNVLKGKNKDQRELIAMTLKSLMVSEDNPIQLVLAGLKDVESFVKHYSEVQRRSRFVQIEGLVLPRDSANLMSFLSNLERKLGFPDAGFTKHGMPERFMFASRGLVGRAAYFAQEAATLAVSLDNPNIEREYLAEIYKRIYNVSPKQNPFLMADISKFQVPKSKDAQEQDDLTFLKGTKPGDDESANAAAD